jgi:hypothetical protein
VSEGIPDIISINLSLEVAVGIYVQVGVQFIVC